MDLGRSQDCVFCDIVAGEAEASIVYEDDIVNVFLDIGPVTEGHLMVVPKRHLPQLADLDDETAAHMFTTALRMAQALRDSDLRCEGINLFYADGEVAFQEVFHAHLHVFARYRGDSFRINADWNNVPSRTELDRQAGMIREGLAAG